MTSLLPVINSSIALLFVSYDILSLISSCTLYLWLLCSFGYRKQAITDTKDPRALKIARYFILLKRYPKVMLLTFMLPFFMIVTFFIVTCCTFFIKQDKVDTLTTVFEALFFSSLYFFCLSITSFSFPCLQVLSNRKDWMFKKFPIQYQDRFFAACGVSSLLCFVISQAILQFKSKDTSLTSFQSEINTAAVFIYPWTMIIRSQPFMRFHSIFVALSTNAVPINLLIYITIHYGGIISYLAFIYKIIDSLFVVIVLITVVVIFLVIPNLIILLKSKVRKFLYSVPKKNERYSHFNIGEVKFDTLSSISGVGLKSLFFQFSCGRIKFPLFLYGIKTPTEDSLESAFLIFRKEIKLPDGNLYLTKFIITFFILSPIIIITAALTDSLFSIEYKNPQEIRGLQSPHFGRALYPLILNYKRVIFVVDLPGFRTAISFLHRFNTNHKALEENLIEREVTFIWICRDSEDSDFLLTLQKEQLDSREVPKIDNIIVHSMKSKTLISRKLFFKKKPAASKSKIDQTVFNEIDSLLQRSLTLKGVDESDEVSPINETVSDNCEEDKDTVITTIGSSSLVGLTSAIASYYNIQHFEQICENKFTETYSAISSKNR